MMSNEFLSVAEYAQHVLGVNYLQTSTVSTNAAETNATGVSAESENQMPGSVKFLVID